MTEVDICNQALALLGDRAQVVTISPPDGSAQSALCARLYPVCRDAMLEASAGWTFSTREAFLSATLGPVGGWPNSFALPNGLSRVLNVMPFGATGTGVAYAIRNDGGTIKICAAPTAIRLVYTVKVTDTALFSQLFSDALAARLASMLAGPLFQDERGVKMSQHYLELSNYYVSLAQSADSAQQRSGWLPPTAPWVQARGAGTDKNREQSGG